jgi:hypothetical protein
MQLYDKIKRVGEAKVGGIRYLYDIQNDRVVMADGIDNAELTRIETNLKLHVLQHKQDRGLSQG